MVNKILIDLYNHKMNIAQFVTVFTHSRNYACAVNRNGVSIFFRTSKEKAHDVFFLLYKPFFFYSSKYEALVNKKPKKSSLRN